MRIVALDQVAERSGLSLGQGITEARAIRPVIDVIPADPAADRAFLEGLADWCDRYTPLVAMDGDRGLFLDITGCTHLHGGEKALLDDLLLRLFHLGVEARAAISNTPGLSWAMAHFGATGMLAAAEDAQDILSPMPLAALRLARDTVGTLARVGLTKVGDILHLPRAPLVRRFGPHLLLRLDQALGLEDEPLSPRLAVASLSMERRLLTPVEGEDDILGLALQLAKGLVPGLEERGEGGRLFELLLFRVDGKVFRIQARTAAALRDPARVAGLYRERLQAVHDDLDAGYGFEIVRLSVLKAEPFDQAQQDFSGTADQNLSLAAFADKVVARLGPDSLSVPVLMESHLPERAAAFQPLSDMAALSAPARAVSSTGYYRTARPLRLFQYPEPVQAFVAGVPEGAPESFEWRRTLHRVERAEGPERIAAEWWVDGETAPTRDYFRIEDQNGHRFWLYRNGLYGHGTTPPRWFMHGVFA
ncbi:DNA repair protein [Pararhizobium antarcticum]|uniref:DNA repair protein n=2 Tax=Pararhizobium antarcticum TaxID=1798805 RepID=A0A657LQS7_9HYPH|nr:DNA repair protein [Pararhizobium antarcticum]OJG01142.1 DNA repair protein [Rhizobium sp. 58]